MVLIPKKAVFLDRDGVLNHSEVVNGKPYAPRRIEDFIIDDQAYVALDLLIQAGFLLIVVTNQPDVGNGLVDRDTVEAMHRKLLNDLPVNDIKVCYHSQSAGCSCRKPKPGMLKAAALEFDIDLERSYMVGDRWGDISAGKAAGCYTILIDRGYSETLKEEPHASVSGILEATKNILERG